MANNKIPVGYQGTYAKDANGAATLIMVSRNEYDTAEKPKKEQPKTEEERQPYTPYSKEQKQEYANNSRPTKLSRTATDSGAHTRTWETSASAIRFSFTTI